MTAGWSGLVRLLGISAIRGGGAHQGITTRADTPVWRAFVRTDHHLTTTIRLGEYTTNITIRHASSERHIDSAYYGRQCVRMLTLLVNLFINSWRD